MAQPSDMATPLVVTTTVALSGGGALARAEDGRAIFVDGALPREVVEVEVTEIKRDFSRGLVTRVIGPSPDRVEPPCRYVAEGCGGCDLQHLRPQAQPDLKREIVIDALRRIGRLADPNVASGVPLPATGYRTTIRCGVVNGRLAYRTSKSHDLVAVDECLIAHPLVDEIVRTGRFGDADEVIVRVGVATGDRLVIVAPTAERVEVPDDVIVVGADDLKRGKQAFVHEIVCGNRFQISARSFFQARPDGAEALVEVLRRLGGDALATARTIVDAYAGVGLFAALFAAQADLESHLDREVIAIEWSKSSANDAQVNLANRRARVVRTDVERWRSSSADVVIADPSRSGLGRKAVSALVTTGAPVFLLVSCDAASLGRDAGLLAADGYAFDRAELVDLFPHTHHLEVVSLFRRLD